MSSAPELSGWCVTLTFDLSDHEPSAFAAFEQALVDPDQHGEASFALVRDEKVGSWRIDAVLPQRPEAERLDAKLAAASLATGFTPRDIAIEKLPETDWVEAVNRASPAITIGPFHIRGSHIEAPAPTGLRVIVLDSGQAFGTGTHETTRGCLMAIAKATKPPAVMPALDLGTGSGLLAIAMARLWDTVVIASDNDAIAVAVAGENAAANGVGDKIMTYRSVGFASPRLRSQAPYGFIAANILAQPLIRLAPLITRYLAPQGRAVLSGIIAEQEAAVSRAYAQSGLVVLDRIAVGDWPTLIVGLE